MKPIQHTCTAARRGRTLFITTAICLLMISQSQAQSTLTATGSSGSAYSTIENQGYAIENPDCEHTSFGAHITQASDATLGKNVFIFHSHITADNDRCTNFDRVRTEIKADNTTAEHTQGTTAYYRWKFKLDAGFIGGSSFCHVFQIKAFGGSDEGAPLITITPRSSILEVIHDGGDDGSGTDLGRLASADLSLFKGVWVEAYVKYLSADNGSFEITLKRVSDGTTLLSYNRTSGIDMYRSGANWNRPKWGVYRSKNSTGLRDEQVRFADFCVSESSASQCPSGAGSGGGSTFSGFYRITPRHSGKALVVQSASPADLAPVVQYTYGGSNTNDEWELRSIGSGYYRIINRNSSKDMVVQSASTSDGGAIVQYTYGGSSTNDEWQLVSVGSGYYRITNRNSGKSVEVASSSTSDGAAVNQRTYSGGTNQQFQLVSISSGARMAAGLPEETIVQQREPLTILSNAGSNPVVQLHQEKEGSVELAVYDISGRRVEVLLNRTVAPGLYSLRLQGQYFSSGMYLVRMVQNGTVTTKKLVKD